MLAVSLLLSALAMTAPASTDAERKPVLLVLGGTSLIGPHLVPAAQNAGFEVVLFNRGKTNADLFPEVEKLRGDRDPDVGDGLRALEGRKFDAVIDTSGHVPRHVRAGAKLLAANSSYYVFVSSLSAYDSHDEPGAKEDAKVAPLLAPSEDFRGDAFGPLKALCEAEVREAFGERCAIVRPGLIIGPRDRSDRFTYWVARMERGGDVLAPGDPADPIRVIDVRDLAEWLVKLAQARTPGTFNAIGPAEPLTLLQVIEACKEAAGKEATLTWVDADFLEARDVHPWTDLPVWIPPRAPMRGFHLRSNSAAIEAGLTFRPILETAKDTLEWFRTLPAERREKLRVGINAEREAELLREYREAR